MRRNLIAVLLVLMFMGCAALSALSAVQMGRTYGKHAAGSIGALTGKDLMVLTALHPDTQWTAYMQSQPQQIVNDTLATRTSKAAVLTFLGAPERIAFFPVLSGRLPMDDEHNVCALDQGTAFRLFGSTDPGEVSIRLNDEATRVIGVIDVSRPLVLVPAERGGAFDRLVAGDRDALLALMTALDIDPDSFELSGAERTKLAWLLCAVPWLLATVMILTTLRNRGGWHRIAAAVLFCVLLLGTLLVLLLSVPVRLLPNRWSDFGFYGEQLDAFNMRPFRAPDVRDALLNSDTLRVGLLSAAACIALWMERMWQRCGKSH